MALELTCMAHVVLPLFRYMSHLMRFAYFLGRVMSSPRKSKRHILISFTVMVVRDHFHFLCFSSRALRPCVSVAQIVLSPAALVQSGRNGLLPFVCHLWSFFCPLFPNSSALGRGMFHYLIIPTHGRGFIEMVQEILAEEATRRALEDRIRGEVEVPSKRRAEDLVGQRKKGKGSRKPWRDIFEAQLTNLYTIPSEVLMDGAVKVIVSSQHYQMALFDRVHDVGRVITSMDNKVDLLRREVQRLKEGGDPEVVAAVEGRASEVQSLKEVQALLLVPKMLGDYSASRGVSMA
ncbi:hypothetical protein BHM03_00033127 [Ensete ventricosum]|nr:hypothetical protein BHM03_00033127 [Ensete ventricosum]